MAGKQEPMKNLGKNFGAGAGAGGSRTKRQADLMSDLMLRPCSGGHAQMEEEKASLVGGDLGPCGGRPSLGKKEAEEDAVTGGKRKAEHSELPASAAAAADTTVMTGPSFEDPAVQVKYVDMPKDYLFWVLSQEKLGPSPYDPRQSTRMSQEEIEQELERMRKLDTLLEGVEDEFFAFQAWVRETYQTKGRVLVPEDFITKGPIAAFTFEE